MASFRFTELAQEQVARLPRDSELLRGVWRRLELAADDIEFYTEYPPPFPHRRDRRLLEFRADDSKGDEWAFSVLFAEPNDGLLITQFAFNKSEEYPDSENDSE